MSGIALDTIVYTPTGYKLAKDIKVGDYVMGKNGKPTKVLATCNNKDVEMYRITFSDGAVVECGGEQLWDINRRGVNQKKSVKTSWFMEKDRNGNFRNERLRCPSGAPKYWIDLCKPVQFKHRDVTVDPYVLGALIGDGYLGHHIQFAKTDTFIAEKMNERLGEGYCLKKVNSKSCDYTYILIKTITSKKVKNKVKQHINDMGLLGKKAPDKFVPSNYLYNDIDTRLDMLNGLMDTDGSARKDGACRFYTVSNQMVEGIGFVVESLGGVYHFSITDFSKTDSYGKLPGYTVGVQLPDPTVIFTLPRKKDRTHKRTKKRGSGMKRRSFAKVERIENADTKFIVTDNEDSTFLVEHFVVMSCKVSE